jgi:hypothetical protein
MRTVYVCTGKDCRRLSAPLRSELQEANVEVQTVGCQNICHGPVGGCVLNGSLYWFERLDGPKALVALTSIDPNVSTEELPKALRHRMVKQRTGRLRD